jgi:hypothetical protein
MTMGMVVKVSFNLEVKERAKVFAIMIVPVTEIVFRTVSVPVMITGVWVWVLTLVIALNVFALSSSLGLIHLISLVTTTSMLNAQTVASVTVTAVSVSASLATRVRAVHAQLAPMIAPAMVVASTLRIFLSK